MGSEPLTVEERLDRIDHALERFRLGVRVLGWAALIISICAIGLAWQVDRRNSQIDDVATTVSEARSAALEARDLVQGAVDGGAEAGEASTRAIAEIHRIYCRVYPADCNDPVPDPVPPSTVTPTTVVGGAP